MGDATLVIVKKVFIARHSARDFLADVLLNIWKEIGQVFISKADRLSACSRPGRSADAMDVVLSILGQIVVDHVGYAFDMQSA